MTSSIVNLRPRPVLRLLAVDPGSHSIAWALFDNASRLAACDMVRATSRPELALALRRAFEGARGEVAEVIVEQPQVYVGRRSKGDPNDLIAVAVTVGQVVQEVQDARVRLVRPHDWKGSRPKDVHNRSTLARLTPGEVDLLDQVDAPRSLRHNVIDAIGIGLWALGRAGT